MIYCDTSVFVTALTTEPHSQDIQNWMAARADSGIAISAWVETEFASAMAMKLRRGDLDENELPRVLAVWDRLRDSLVKLPVETRHFDRATVFVQWPGIVLRSADALHLAVASDSGSALATLDREMAVAARAVGLQVDMILPRA